MLKDSQSFARFVVWSNAFYLIPLVAAVYARFWIDALVLAALIFISTLFHLSRERRFVIFDIAISLCAIFVNAAAVYHGGFKSPYTMVIGVLIGLGLYIRYVIERGDSGSVAHGWWHLVASAILTACVFSYVG